MAKKKTTDSSPDPPTTAETGASPGDAAQGNGQTPPRRPVRKFRCAAGKDTSLDVAVWENEVQYPDGGKGKQYAITFTRSYKNGEGWVTNHSYRIHELPVLLHLLQKAHDWCLTQRTVEDTPL